MICSSVKRLRFIRPYPSRSDSTFKWLHFRGACQNPKLYADRAADFIKQESEKRASGISFCESHHLTAMHHRVTIDTCDYLLNLLSSTPRNSPRNFSAAVHKGKLHFKDHYPNVTLVDPVGANLDSQITWGTTIIAQMESEITDGPQGFRTDLKKLSTHTETPLISIMFGRAQNETAAERLHALVCTESKSRKEPFISVIQILRAREPISKLYSSVRVYL